MSTIDDLLAQSLLLREPHVPADVVPHDEPLDDDLLLWQHRGDDTVDDSAARSLDALCETVVSHCTPAQLADFLTDQIPQPHTARILGCALHLAGVDIGARFWWQYAAGAEDTPASYCLYLQHLAHGETHAAALWHAQTGLYAADQDCPDTEDYAPALQSMSADSSLATVLRVLAQLTSTMPTRRHTPAARAVIEFVASAVAGGYSRHPDLEIPLPGTYFAEQLEIVVAATTTTPDQFRSTSVHATPEDASPPVEDLPNRLAPDEDRKHIPTKAARRGPEHLLVQVTAADHEPTTAHTFFEDAAAVCWKTATAATEQDTRGNGMAYRLRRFAQRLSPAPSGFGQLRTAASSGGATVPFHRL
ncbi:hypothetical protein BN159_2570 [Streptomyces davaonensis JCM 4913]|uniref:Uncharacterized protein n=1 Tax=Streptomyces davaonensis (strain DSM 101723 / JCM 4913 / KCC S-0913 / 768) TaxID=1214101 RepID=K4R2Q1_STRDJ|nr:hypothetical protein [Streptomyces davaonensis]CCK26949.1 hypothetical protein BN159_2570 [Streptomyces davaonensis JCM 4913]